MSLTNQAVPSNQTKKDRHEVPSPSSRPCEMRQRQPRMVRLTVSLPADLVDRLRDAVYWSPNLTLAWLIAQSLRASLADLEKSRQGPFPKRMMSLRVGRPRLVGQTMSLSSYARFAGKGTAYSTIEGAQSIPAPRSSIE